MKNYQVRARGLTERLPTPADFELVESAVPTPRKGEMLCRTQWLALDPHLRPRQAGELLPARAICEVVESLNEIFNKGEWVVMDSGVQNYCVSTGVHVQRLRTGGAPATAALSVMGVPGLTAYCGLLDLAEVRQGETVLVSAAAGAVGSMVGQIARIKGCRVIGIAETREKSQWCVREAHFSACIDLSYGTLSPQLRQLVPNGVNVYFDNSGGAMLREFLSGDHMAAGGRVVLAAGDGLAKDAAARARLLPLTTANCEHRREAFLKDVFAWYAEGHLRYREDIVEGVHNAAEHFCRLLRGENFGKALVKV